MVGQMVAYLGKPTVDYLDLHLAGSLGDQWVDSWAILMAVLMDAGKAERWAWN
jgi:hypothetical protein